MTTDLTQSDPGVAGYEQRGAQMKAAEAAERSRMRRMRFDTIAARGVYGLEAVQANQGSINEPAYFSSAQAFENSDHLETALAYRMPAWTYSRYGNPTTHYLEETLALLEGYGLDGEASACATASGMAAIFVATNAFLAQLPGRSMPPVNIVACTRIYGGTFTLFTQRYAGERGIEVRWVRDPLDLDEWARQMDENTRFVYGEMPSNPGLDCFDVAALAEIAHARRLPLIVDSTVATPALLRPLCLGADIVVHSVSKSMAVSGLAIAGAVISRKDIFSDVLTAEQRQDFAAQIKLLPFRDYGPGLSPFNALMALTDLRTLRLRMDRLSQSSQQIAETLVRHPKVERVYYPGLPDFPGHAVARRTLWLADGEVEYGQPVNRYGHLLSFTVKGGEGAARRVYNALELVLRAADMGRIKSLATIPAISTHQQQGEAGRALAAIPANLIRLSVGAEHPLDLLADLEQALEKA